MMSKVIDFFLHAPDLATWIAAIPLYLLPDGRPLATLPTVDCPAAEANALCYPQDVGASEIGEIPRPAVYDEEGNEIAPAVVIGGYHVNMWAEGLLARFLTYGCPTEGSLFERTKILQLLPDMVYHEASDGLPRRYVGPNGISLFDPADVDQPARVRG